MGFSHFFGARFSRQSCEKGGFTASTLTRAKTIPPAAHGTLKRPLLKRRIIHAAGVLPVQNSNSQPELMLEEATLYSLGLMTVKSLARGEEN